MSFQILGASEITADLYCNFVYLYWDDCVIGSIYLRYIPCLIHNKDINVHNTATDSQTDKEIKRHNNKQTHKQTGNQTHILMTKKCDKKNTTFKANQDKVSIIKKVSKV